MILIDRKKPERMLEIFSLEHLSSIPIHEIEKFLMPVGFIPFQETAVEKFELSLAVRRALGMLTPREEKIVRMRFGIDERAEHSWVELGELFDVSQSTIKRIYKNAFKKLKNPPISKLLKPFYNDYQLEPDRNFKLIN